MSAGELGANDLPAERAAPADAAKADAAAAYQPPYPGLRALIQGDVAAWTELYSGWRDGKPAGLLTILRLAFVFAGLRATLIQRFAHAAYRTRLPLVPNLLTALNITLHGFEMAPHTIVGPGLYVAHPVGTVVVAERLGAKVTLVSAVTIGMRKEPGFPVIGDEVYVGAGARILGDIKIGDRVQIGANAVVIKDVPSDSVAVGVPATVRTARPKA